MQKIVFSISHNPGDFGCPDLTKTPVDFEIFLEDPYVLGSIHYDGFYMIDSGKTMRCEIGLFTEMLVNGDVIAITSLKPSDELLNKTSSEYYDYLTITKFLASKKIINDIMSEASRAYLDGRICDACNLINYASEILDKKDLPTFVGTLIENEGFYQGKVDYLNRELKKGNIRTFPDKVEINNILKEVRRASHVTNY